MNKRLSVNDVAAILIITALNSALFVNFHTAVYAQQQRYVSPINGFAITLYPGFVIHDISQSAINAGKELLQSSENFEHIGTVCLEQDSTPSFGGTVECEPSGGESATLQSGAEIRINRFSNLLTRPELQGTVLAHGKQITPQDILTMDLKLTESVIERAYPEGAEFVTSQIISQTPMNVNYVDANGTKHSLPALYAQTALVVGPPGTSVADGVSFMGFGVYTVTPDQDTGYALLSPRWDAQTTTTAPVPIMDMLRSFEVIAQ